MSFVDKFKKILFDDVDDSDELPERTPKGKKDEKHESTGFIDYHNNEEDEENPIREIKVPQEEKSDIHVEEKEKTNKFNFPSDSEFDREVPTRSRNYEEMDIDFFKEDKDEETKLVKEVNSFMTEPEPQKKEREIRDYRKMLSTEEEPTKEKKPFTNTPVISPVWGILDKNYKPEEIVDRTETLTKVNTGAMPRSYGPVSYNDQPLVQRKPKARTKVQSKKADELIELNTTISDLINEPIEEEVKKIKEEVVDTPDVRAERELDEIIESAESKNTVPTHSIDDIDDEIIKTDNYDEIDEIDTSYEDSSIEVEEKANNNIEDAFESTSEFDTIRENYMEDDSEEDLVDLASIVNKKDDDNDEDDAGLDNTIETDLFNLIDSMYKDEDE